MLNIWYYTDVERMLDAPAYFNNTYEDEWLEDPVVQEMILDVDKSKVIRLEHPSNMETISVTLLVLKLDKSIDFKPELI